MQQKDDVATYMCMYMKVLRGLWGGDSWCIFTVCTAGYALYKMHTWRCKRLCTYSSKAVQSAMRVTHVWHPANVCACVWMYVKRGVHVWNAVTHVVHANHMQSTHTTCRAHTHNMWSVCAWHMRHTCAAHKCIIPYWWPVLYIQRRTQPFYCGLQIYT